MEVLGVYLFLLPIEIIKLAKEFIKYKTVYIFLSCSNLL